LSSRSDVYGAAAGAIAIALFAGGSAIIGAPPDFEEPGSAVVRYFVEGQTRIQVGSAIAAASIPFLIWFLVTVARLASDRGHPAPPAATTALGCGIAFGALYVADLAMLGVGALRPNSLASAPELATVIHDLSWILPALGAPLGAGIFIALSMLIRRHEIPCPGWMGWAAAVAGTAYLLRLGALFGTDGPFAADGLIGLWIPVVAVSTWTVLASSWLAFRLARAQPESA
jgi:hypothetical protein